jgi:hypothetical protein
MEAMLNEEELRLLAHLHETATGYHRLLHFRPHKVGEAIGCDEDQMKKMLTYLEGWGFVEIGDWVGGHSILFFHFTAIGEAYMRKVDAELVEKGLLERGKKMGVGLVKTGGKVVLGVVQKALEEYVKLWVLGTAGSHR